MDVDLDEGGGGDGDGAAWMATFSDLATLLLTFFILLLSFANMDVQEFRMALGSVREALGVPSESPGTFEALSTSLMEFSDKQTFDSMSVFDEGTNSAEESSEGEGEQETADEIEAMIEALRDYLETQGLDAQQIERALSELRTGLAERDPNESALDVLQKIMAALDLDETTKAGIEYVAKQLFKKMENDRDVVAEMKHFLDGRGIGDKVEVELSKRGILMRMRDAVLFDSGDDDVRAVGKPVLDVVAELALEFPDQGLSIEGHTDDLPIQTGRFPSNWELSTARASSVLRYLHSVHGVSPNRLHLAGYGEERPLAANTNAESRARNRRVEFVFERGGALRHGLPERLILR